MMDVVVVAGRLTYLSYEPAIYMFLFVEKLSNCWSKLRNNKNQACQWPFSPIVLIWVSGLRNIMTTRYLGHEV
jgi:hypothetical protein